MNRIYQEPNEGAWKVVFKGTIQAPDFNSSGAADAFLTGLINGTRHPEPQVNG